MDQAPPGLACSEPPCDEDRVGGLEADDSTASSVPMTLCHDGGARDSTTLALTPPQSGFTSERGKP